MKRIFGRGNWRKAGGCFLFETPLPATRIGKGLYPTEKKRGINLEVQFDLTANRIAENGYHQRYQMHIEGKNQGEGVQRELVNHDVMKDKN